MKTVTEIKDRLAGAARSQAEQYAGGENRPLGGYATTMTVYVGTVAALATAVKASGKSLPDGLAAGDLVLCAASTHKLSRLIAKDPVTSPLRAPFTAYKGTQGPSELAEDVRGEGGQKTVGELLTCPFCTGMWVATGFTAGLLLMPRTTRLAMGALTALTGADILQFAHAWLEKVAG
ncbi:MAG TPA: DUF1360 domain-containing protein [Streptosporangiaceae bacterium]